MTINMDRPEGLVAEDAWRAMRTLTRAVQTADDLSSIFEAALISLEEALGVTQSSILIFDEEGVMRFTAWRNLSEPYRAAVEGHSPWRPEDSNVAPVLVEEVAKEPSLAHLADAIRSEGIEALAFIPLVASGKLLGKFMLYYPGKHEFSEAELSIAETIAAQAAFAIEQQEARRERELTARVLSGQKHTLELLTNAASLEDVLASLTNLVEELSEPGVAASILLLSDANRLHNGASPSLPHHYLDAIDGLPADSQVGTCCAAAALGTPVFTPDFESDPRWRGLAHLPLSIGYRGAWSQPILSRDGKILGTFGTYFTEARTPSSQERRLVEVLASTAAIAIERFQSETALRESERRYRELVNASGVAMYTVDEEGRIVLFNDAAVRMWGRTPEVGKDSWCGSWKIYDLSGNPMPLDQCPMAIALKERRPVRDVEILVERPDGSRAFVLPYPTPLRDTDGKVVGAVNIMIDITARHEADEAKTRALAAKDEFLGLVSHELRTPISTILANGLLLDGKEALLSAEEKSDMYADIVAEATKLNENVENLLLLTRVARDMVDVGPISLTSLVEHGLNEFRSHHPDRQIDFLAAGVVQPVLGNDTLVGLVFQNFLTNAAKYSPPDSPICVEVVSGSDGQPGVIVSDKGIGLDDEDLQRLFTPFHRSLRAREQAGGMGLGLAICKRVIEALDGRVWAEPRDGGGASFYFTLPLAAPGFSK